MNIGQIEKNLSTLVRDISPETFVFDLLRAYGIPKATVTLLSQNPHKLSKRQDQIVLKKKLLFQAAEGQDLHGLIDSLAHDQTALRHNPRFIIVTDYTTLLAVNTKTDDTLDIKITDLHKHPFFFGPWAGMEKYQGKNENLADVKAAEKMARIYDEILKDNHFSSKEDLHSLNIFLSRLLFCFFAEDTGIFKDGAFTASIASHTQPDGEDLSEYLNRLFEALNTPDRSTYPEHLAAFPYVNGGLFGNKYFAPKFSRKSRKMIIECGELDWSAINPDIFGSMIQAVVHPDQRGGMGMHYTSVPNIMKVIEPLFLNELREEFEESQDNPKKLDALLKRLSSIRVFDPACGSGNFLIIAYKELRQLEIEILQRLAELRNIVAHTPVKQLDWLPKVQQEFALTYEPTFLSIISLSQFYGIELDDFAHEVAILSLWLAEHQMNVKFKEVFGQANATLPLKEGGNIVCDNATRIAWEDVCPKDDGVEIYVLGNPPYLGFLLQDKDQKEDMDIVFDDLKTIKKLDYISCWFFKGSKYIRNSSASLAFVSTNSLCQGEQVSLFWPYILRNNLEISFAHTSFKWTNNAKRNAGVVCIVVGLRNKSPKKKYLFREHNKIEVDQINAYLAPTKEIYVTKHNNPLSNLPKISLGSAAYDGGYLMITKEEYCSIISQYPESKKFLKRFIGSAEFFKGIERYCIWIDSADAAEAQLIPPIKNRIDKVRDFRSKSDRKQTKDTVNTPYAFTENRHIDKPSIIVPIITSERREYYVCGFLDGSQVIPNAARAIYDPEPYVFGVVSSKIHMVWVRAVAGRLKTDYRYSAGVCYNGFPFPDISQKQKETISTHVYNVLEEREKHPEKTMAELYDPDKMPDGLREAHHDLDVAVERCYRSKPFTSDEERLEYLFKLYEDMISKEKTGDLL